MRLLNKYFTVFHTYRISSIDTVVAVAPLTVCCMTYMDRVPLMPFWLLPLYRLKERLLGKTRIDPVMVRHYEQALSREEVTVSWKREHSGIVGEVRFGDAVYYAQGNNADSFIACVNDVLYAVSNVPWYYIPILGGHRRVLPRPEEYQKLANGNVTHSTASLTPRAVSA